MSRLTYFRSSGPMHVLVRVDQHRLELRSTATVRIIGSLVMGCGVALAPTSPWFAFLLLAGILGLLGPCHAMFDRQRRTLRLRRLLRFRTFPLAEVQSVEILADERRSPSKHAYPSWEMALAMDSSYAPRLYLTNHGDYDLTRQMAREIGGFLGTPIHDGTASAPPRPAQGQPQRKKKRKKP